MRGPYPLRRTRPGYAHGHLILGLQEVQPLRQVLLSDLDVRLIGLEHPHHPALG